MEQLGITDLRPGDVLLYRGNALLSRLIQHFDGSPASHVAIYLGGGQVGEAVAEGVVPRDWETSFHGAEWVRVYRLVSDPADMGPVLGVASAILGRGERYGYEQLLMLAVLCTTRKIQITPVLRRLLRTLLDAATRLLVELTQGGREPMICSEFVYRCYDQAKPSVQDEYSIDIGGMLPLPGGARGAGPARGVSEESLAALFASPASSLWIPPSAEAAQRGVDEAPGMEEVEALAEAYLQEVEAPRRAAADEEEVSLGELRAATDRFVISVYRSRSGAQAGARAAVEDERSAAYDYLFQATPDFVTPADFWTTESLSLVGEVDH